jgi:integrase
MSGTAGGKLARGIDRLPSGSYRVRVGRDGRTYTRTARTKTEAERIRARLISTLDDGSYVDRRSGRTPLSEWFCADDPLYGEIGWLPSRSLRSTSERAYRALWRLHIDPVLGRVPLTALTPHELEGLKAGWRRRGVGVQTQAAAWRLLMAVLNGAVKANRIPRNPSLGVDAPRATRRQQRYLNIGELRALADAIGEEHRAIVLLAGIGGLRIGEIAGLDVRHVDVRRVERFRGFIRVEQQAIEVGGHVELAAPKTDESSRTISAGPILAEELYRHRERRLRDGAEPTDPLFTTPTGKRLVPSRFRRLVFHPAAAAAGLEPLRIHDLRHTAVAIALEQGLNMKAIQARLGHGSIRTTLDTYGHLVPDSLDDDAERLERGLVAAWSEQAREEQA